jgi:hypothetical protein
LRKTRLVEQGQEEQRIEMMGQLALEAWELMGEPVLDERVPRHIVRVIRGKEGVSEA